MVLKKANVLPAPVIPAPEPVVKVQTVGELLRASMSAHFAARSGRQRPANWLDHLKRAADLRRQAAMADPGFADPAWSAEEHWTPRSHNTHKVLMAFYESKGL